MRTAFYSLAAVTGLMAAPLCHAQCPDWRGRPIFHQDGRVYAATTWDPDGAGPQGALLVVGGSFNRANGPGGITVSNIAAWDGVLWQALGSGVDGAVNALAVYNGQLVAAGQFTTAGGVTAYRVARWNGSAWLAVGGGLGSSASSTVNALSVFNGELVAAGRLTVGGSVTNVARWSGAAWQSYGAPLGATSDVAWDVAVYNGQLHVGGRLLSTPSGSASIARWNGAAWQPVAPGSSTASVFALHVYGGELIAGGSFPSTLVGAANVARWNGGLWRPLGAGIVGYVSALATHNGQLIAGGGLSMAGGQPAQNIARWDGAAWDTLRDGANDLVNALSVYDGDLIVGGQFSVAGVQTVDSLARWDGEFWSALPGVAAATSGDVAAIVPWGDSVVIGGTYTTAGTHEPADYRNLTRFDGARITGLGDPDGPVYGAATAPGPGVSTDLVVGGSFSEVGGVAAARIARINDTVATGWQAMGAGFNGVVHDVEYYGGSIYAAGSFTASGAAAVGRIARWNGSAWVALGAGLNGTAYTLKSHNGSLYVGGVFTTAGGVATGRLARWNGSAWSVVGAAFNGTSVNDLAVYNNQLVIGGSFPGVGGSANIVRFNGSLLPMGSGTNGPVYAVTVSDGTLVAGGAFTVAGGLNVSNLVRWDGSAWLQWHHATDGPVHALGAYRNELHVGGAFASVRNGVIESPLWARFSEDGVPWFVDHPQSGVRNCGQNFSPDVTMAQGYGGLGMQWRKDGVALVNGPTGTGSTIIGANGNFGVIGVSPADSGSYDCVVTSSCGSVTSLPATLTVIMYANCDNSTMPPVLNVNDFVCFQSRFAAGDPYANCDGSTTPPVLNVNDFICFQSRFAAGCQ